LINLDQGTAWCSTLTDLSLKTRRCLISAGARLASPSLRA
jgi:hypothetical protein